MPAHANPDQNPTFYDPETHSYVLTVESAGAPHTPYIEKIHVNGQLRQEAFIRWEEFSVGGSIRFDMIRTRDSDVDSDVIHEELYVS